MNKSNFRVWDLQEKRYYYSGKENPDRYALSLNGELIDLETGASSSKVVVQQHTGLKDNKGRDIYEGDIVTFNDVLYNQLPAIGTAEVIFTTDLSLVDAPCYGLWFKNGFHKNMLGEITVLGNIFESPELAEEEKAHLEDQADGQSNTTDKDKIVPLKCNLPEPPPSKELQKIFYDIEKLEAERTAWKQMFDMQTNIVTSLELDKIRLEKEIATLKSENTTLQSYLDNIYRNLQKKLSET